MFSKDEQVQLIDFSFGKYLYSCVLEAKDLIDLYS